MAVRWDMKRKLVKSINSSLKVLIQANCPQRNGGEKNSKGNTSHFNMLCKERLLKGNLAGNFIPLNFQINS